MTLMNVQFVRADKHCFCVRSSLFHGNMPNNAASNGIGLTRPECFCFWFVWVPRQTESMETFLSAGAVHLNVNLTKCFMKQLFVDCCGTKKMLVVDMLHNGLLLFCIEQQLRWTILRRRSTFLDISMGNCQFICFLWCPPDVLHMVMFHTRGQRQWICGLH